MQSYVVYSPLCDQDKQLYQEYLESCRFYAKYGFADGNGLVVGRGDGSSLVQCGQRVCEEGVCVNAGCDRLVGAVRSGGACHEGVGSDAGTAGSEIVGKSHCGAGEGRTAVSTVFDRLQERRESTGSPVLREVDVQGCEFVDRDARLLGPNGGVSVGRGRNYEKNSARRKRARKGLTGGWRSSFSDDQRRELAESRAARFKAENELAAKRAQQQLAVVNSLDIDVMKKRRQTQLVKETEVNKVQIEKAFGTLSLTGNVPGVHGSVHTVTTGSVPSLNSGSISPNSSVSMHEIHEMQKENLSLKVVAEKVDRVKDMAPDLYQIWFGERKTLTVDTGYTCENGMPVALKGDPDLVGYIDSNKRFHYGPDPNYEEYDLDNY